MLVYLESGTGKNKICLRSSNTMKKLVALTLLVIYLNAAAQPLIALGDPICWRILSTGTITWNRYTMGTTIHSHHVGGRNVTS